MDPRQFERLLHIANMSSEYNQLFLQLRRLYVDQDYSDKKEAHRLQDIIYRKFIQDILENRINNIEHIQTLASQIKENVIIYDKTHDY